MSIIEDRDLKTSVIIFTKNRPAELAKCIKSVESQSLTPDEVVVADGGDTKITHLRLLYGIPKGSI